MHDFKYVPYSEWKPNLDQLHAIIHKLQDEVRPYFTFHYYLVGSSKYRMITRDSKSNIGYDFDVNIEVNDPEKNYNEKEIRDILRNGLNKILNPLGRNLYGYGYAEDSTRVLTIKVPDRKNSRILHSCDFCIVFNCNDGKQKYIRYNKKQNDYSWEYQPKGYTNLSGKIDWIKQHGLWGQVRDLYLYKKNTNIDPHKRSRALFAETIHEIRHKNNS